MRQTLLIAAQKNELENVKQLLAQGASTHSYSSDNQYSPLHWATYHYNPEMIHLLLKYNADPSQRNKQKQTPIEIAATNQDWASVLAFTQFKTDEDDTAEYGNALLAATYHNQPNLALKLLKAGASVNSKYIAEKHAGYFPLHFAVCHQQYELACVLLKSGANPNNHYMDYPTALQLAKNLNYQKFITLFEDHISYKNKQYKKLETKLEKLTKKYTYKNYTLTLRKTPCKALYENYLDDLNQYANHKNKAINATRSEKKVIQARKIWTDVVSETDQANLKYSNENGIKQAVIQILSQFDQTNPEKMYCKCIKYLQDNTVAVLTFNAKFLSKGIADFQILNMRKRNNRKNSAYTRNRLTLENGLFEFLPFALQKKFFTNIDALPRYATLLLLDKDTPISENYNYGHSFIVFKEIVKLNSLFLPGDSLDYAMTKNLQDFYKPCTYHHLEFLLWQLPPNTLKAIVNRITNGMLTKRFNQNCWREEGGYLELMIPAINFLDKNLVEAIHINSNEYTLDQKTFDLFNDIGIPLSNDTSSPYILLNKKFITAIKKNQASSVANLLTKYPSLARISNKRGQLPIHIAARYGSIDVFKYFQSIGMDIDTDSTYHLKPLQVAVSYNQLAILKFIIATISQKTKQSITTIFNDDGYSWNVFYLACKGNAFDCAVYLLENSVKLNKQLIISQEYNILETFTALFKKLIKLNQIKALNNLIKQDKSFLDLPLDDNQYTALFYAVVYGPLNTVQHIIEFYKTNNHTSILHLSETALNIAAKKNVNLEIVKYLLTIIKKQNKSYSKHHAAEIKTALMIAHRKKHQKIAHLIAKFYLTIYISKAQQRPKGNYTSTFSLFGIKKNFGYSSDQKLNASLKLKQVVSGNADKQELSQYRGELHNGELGLIHKCLTI